MEYLKRYELWKQSIASSDLEIISKYNSVEIKENFLNELEFGTGGIRSLMGLGSSKLNKYTIQMITLGLANSLIKNNVDNKELSVGISFDCRNNSKEFSEFSANILANRGIKVYIFNELRPTPMLSFLVLENKCSAGIMITASHNPKEYNGYKVYNDSGAQLNVEEATSISNEISKIDTPFFEELKKENEHFIERNVETYIDELYFNNLVSIQVNKNLKKYPFCFSPLHGTGRIIPKFLKRLGYEIYENKEEMVPDGNFSYVANPNPENAIAFKRTTLLSDNNNQSLVMITDPDADRLGVAVKKGGNYIYLTGNQTAAIELYYILSNTTKRGVVCTTNVTTPLIEVIGRYYNNEIVVTPTGFKFIGEVSKNIKGVKDYIFGCEESYGSLIKDFVRDKDAIQAILLLAEINSFLQKDNLDLVDYLEQIYKKFGYFYEYTDNINFLGLNSKKDMEKVMNYFRNGIDFEICGIKIVKKDDLLKGISIDNNHQTTPLNYPKLDVLKYYLSYNEDNDVFIVLRPSGTEPKLKVYFSCFSESIRSSIDVIKTIKEAIKEEINKCLKKED
jgi:phosphoglucomutase